MKAQKVAIIISPFRISPKSGAGEYTRRVLTSIKNSYETLYLLHPKGSPLNIHCDGGYEFSVFGGVGSLLLGLNLDYLLKLSKLMKLIKKNNKSVQIKILLNGVLGTISTYFISKIIGAKSIYIAHNVEKERYFTESVTYKERPVLPLLKLIAFLLEFFATKFDQIVAISHEDKKKFVRLYKVPPEKVVVVPPRISREYYFAQDKIKLNKKDKKVGNFLIVFHGMYNYIPNREGMELIRKYISKNIKYAQFVVFGSSAPNFIEGNFKSIGFVDDLYEFLLSCDIAIVPLRRGAGVKLKMLDYMAVGLPIVTTKKGAEGLDLVNGKHAIIVEDVNEKFIKAIEYLIENPKMRRKLGYNAGKLFEKKYVKV
ncbi:glycosyltransferase family 4 protein [Thermococcus bergensis]|uniref:glycosyltransferase n=1 Tax=Thermococcus bergensis TaxID=2689387 RepID=UPI001CED4AB0|nr:glycosyltransferase [Thermococcus bergensis]MCA6213539.1 glycosyltransferase family 4 protein [Thermococcus bergensis]